MPTRDPAGACCSSRRSSAEYGTILEPDGKRVWFEVDWPGASRPLPEHSGPRPLVPLGETGRQRVSIAGDV